MTNVAKVIVGTIGAVGTIAGAGCVLVWKLAKATVKNPTATNTNDLTNESNIIDVPTTETEGGSETTENAETGESE